MLNTQFKRHILRLNLIQQASSSANEGTRPSLAKDVTSGDINHARAVLDNTCKMKSSDLPNLSSEKQNSGKNKARKRKHDGTEYTEKDELPTGRVFGEAGHFNSLACLLADLSCMIYA